MESRNNKIATQMMKEFGRQWSSMDNSARAPFYKIANDGKNIN